MKFDHVLWVLHFVSGQKRVGRLAQKARSRLHSAFRPKTARCYTLLFRCFNGFCICSHVSLNKVSLMCILVYLAILVKNGVFTNMVANHVSGIKAQFIMYDLNYCVFDHSKVKYYIRALKINCLHVMVKMNIMSLEVLKQLINECNFIYAGKVFQAIFLIAFFGFLRISNLAPHSVGAFDPSKHLTLADITFNSTGMTLTIKWSKTMQTRD